MKKKQNLKLTQKAKLAIAGTAICTLVLAGGIGYQAYKTDLEQKKKPPATSSTGKQTNQIPITIDPQKKEQTIDINGKQVPVKITTENPQAQQEQKKQ